MKPENPAPEPQPAGSSSDPIGLKAAAEKAGDVPPPPDSEEAREAAAGDAGAGGAGEEAPYLQIKPVLWRMVVQTARRQIWTRLEKRDPAWALSAEEAEALDEPWVMALSTLRIPLTPWTMAALCTTITMLGKAQQVSNERKMREAAQKARTREVSGYE